MFVTMSLDGRIVRLKKSMRVSPKRTIYASQMRNWIFSHENTRSGGFHNHAQFKVIDVGAGPSGHWVKLQQDGGVGVGYFKLTGEEFGMNFKLIRA